MHPLLWSHVATVIATLAAASTSETSTSGAISASGANTTTGVDEAARVDTTTDDAARASLAPTDRAEPSSTPWIRRHAPRRNEVELGAYGGVLLPSPRHELYQEDPGRPDAGYEPLATAAGAMGGRLGYAPLQWLAVELEGGAAPTRTAASARATLWHARGSLVGQVGLRSIVPFALVGVGALGVSSSAQSLGNDVDAAIHFGGGMKINTSARFSIRLDLRDTITARRGVDRSVAHTGEMLLGAVIRLGRRPQPITPEPGDRDRDGFLDPDDRCPDTAGIAPDGCPALDRDRDGFLDDVDACPDEPGVAPDGCPLRDRDRDGFLDPDDRCADEPETRNGFEDTDGCPDELPEEVKAFTGVIEGIFFDLDESTIRPKSRPVLDRAVEVLERHPTIRIEISGHTDSSGDYRHNMELSLRRAVAVRNYLAAKGIAEDRITTRGVGSDVPIADNKSKQGRERNRRIEFRIEQ